MRKAFREGLNTVLVSGDAEAFSRRFCVEPSRKATFRESLTVAESHFSREFYAKPSRKLTFREGYNRTLSKTFFLFYIYISQILQFSHKLPNPVILIMAHLLKK